MTGNSGEGEAPRFAIFRGKDAQPYTEMTAMTYAPMSAEASDGLKQVTEAGYGQGYDLNLVFSAPGFSLIRLWFKSSFPLPRHTHDVGCLYYIVGGTLQVGTETLGVGDGFFVGAGTPYTYTPGPDGVEVLEFRAANVFDIKVLADNRAYWDKAVETVRDRQTTWAGETPPSVPAARASSGGT